MLIGLAYNDANTTQRNCADHCVCAKLQSNLSVCAKKVRVRVNPNLSVCVKKVSGPQITVKTTSTRRLQCDHP